VYEMKRHRGVSIIQSIEFNLKKGSCMYEKLTYQPYGNKHIFTVFYLRNITQLTAIPSLTNKRFLIIYDTNLPVHLIQKIQQFFDTPGNTVHIEKIPCGPKSLESAGTLWKMMVDFVPDIVVGVGGGTISDLVGFTSSTYQRGIVDILFPTTVLGMVDASLGGKAGIDFHGVKNCIGAMQYPAYVFNILEFLDTLPKKDIYAGLAETVKAAVLFDEPFFNTLEKVIVKERSFFNETELFSLLVHSSRLKMQNSEQPTEYKIQLLYGHAVGHAVEILEHGALSHGEAVSIGMTIEGALACVLGIWKKDEWKRQTDILRGLNLPILIPEHIDRQELVQKMELYKKLVKDDALGFIFPEKIGVVHSDTNNFCTYIQKKDWPALYAQAITFITDTI
jgi:3-dehydroquinate synthetase